MSLTNLKDKKKKIWYKLFFVYFLKTFYFETFMYKLFYLCIYYDMNN